VGSPIAGRGRPELEGLIGYFANTLPLRTTFDDDEPFAMLLDRVVETCLDAFEHEEVPLEQLALQLQQDGRPATTPLFQAVLTMEDTVPAPIALEGLTAEAIDIAFDATKFDLTMMVAERPDGARVALWYRTELFDADTIDRLLVHFRTLLESVIARPETPIGDLQMLSAAESAQLDRWSPAPRTFDTRPLPAAIAAMAAAHPTRTAIVSGTERLTYAELDSRAQAIAGELVARGVRAGDRVGLLADRSVDAIVGILAVWYAGAAYVALTPDLPPARLARMIEIAGVRTVLGQCGLNDGRLPRGVVSVALDGDVGGAEPHAPDLPSAGYAAYVLFTSGSTGEPKGVVVTHGNLAQYTAAIIERLGASPAEPWRWATVSTLAADLGHTAIFPALATSGTLHVVPANASTDATVWLETMSAEPIDVLKITPSHLRALVGGDAGPIDPARLPLRWLVLGGEALPWTLAEQVLGEARCRVLNHYGPTEATVGACTLEVTRDAVTALRSRARTVPIGGALPHAAAEVLDARGHRVPINVVGDLWLGGAGIAQGYLDRANLTAERFVERDGIRWYRTGDRVRRLSSGDLEFLGRGDGQVKIRGYRVELGEVERVLGAHPGVSATAAALHARDGDARLVGYAVARAGGYAAAHANAADPAGLTAWVAERLPEYMVPSAIVMLDALPLTANGKLYRAALPDPDAAAPVDSYVAPRTETESMLAAIWCDVLKQERVGVTDSFIALGGHSLLAIRALGKISKQLGVRLPLRTLFDTPTIEEIAQRIDAERGGAAEEAELARILAQVEAMPDASLPAARRGTPEPTT
jgi:amino acid adenylation domain-containing protein